MAANWDLVQQAATQVFENWTLMTLAVNQGWGGRNSHNKKKALLKDTLDLLHENEAKWRTEQPEFVRDLAEELSFKLLEDFNVEVEDGSDEEVAQILLKLMRTVVAGDQTYARTILKSTANEAVLNACVYQSPQSDDEFEGDEDDDASADGFVTIGKNNAPKPARKPSVDEDGFVTVGKKSAKPAGKENTPAPVEEADGWTTVKKKTKPVDEAVLADQAVAEALEAELNAESAAPVDDEWATVTKKGKKKK